MRAIILAAGKGLRLNGGTGPKCLLPIGGEPLIERQINALKGEGVTDITVVVGFMADRVRQACPGGVSFVTNHLYDGTNSLYSLWLTRSLLLSGFLVMNSDVLFHPHLLERLLASPHEDAILVAYSNDEGATLGDEEMKVVVSRNLVTEISKSIDPAKAHGENVGIAKFSRNGAELFVRKMEQLIAAGAIHDWAPRAFQEFANERPLAAIGTNGYPWIEIDYLEDYERAVTEIFPRIEANAGWTRVTRNLDVATTG